MSSFDIFILNYLAFFFYSFICWSYESTVWAKAELKRFTNRGFLLGPICPIYGFVSLLDWYALHNIKSPVMIFIVGATVCSIFEYLTSFFLEKCFNKRWWDYSNYPFNINGRISLPSSLFFGMAGLLLVKMVHPFTVDKILKLAPNVRYGIALCIAIMLFVDIVISTLSMKLRSNRVKQIYEKNAEHLRRIFCQSWTSLIICGLLLDFI